MRGRTPVGPICHGLIQPNKMWTKNYHIQRWWINVGWKATVFTASNGHKQRGARRLARMAGRLGGTKGRIHSATEETSRTQTFSLHHTAVPHRFLSSRYFALDPAPPPPPPPPPATPASARLKNRSQPLSCFIPWRRSRTRPPRTPRRPDRAEGQLAGRSSLSAAALPTTDADSSGNPAASLHRASLHFHPRLLKVQHRQEHQGTALSRFAISDSESEIRWLLLPLFHKSQTQSQRFNV
jgi:hypothetical protein